MLIHVRTNTRRLPPDKSGKPQIRINCPACQAQDVGVINAWFLDESVGVIAGKTTNWLRCTACGVTLFSTEPLEVLIGRRAVMQDGVVIQRVSLIRRILALISCCVCIFPILGLIAGISAFIANRKSPRGWRISSQAAMIISIVANAGVLLLIAFTKDH